ncbi:hypothetical protein [Enterovirga aerilata]|nr:hypothetical protein [Enterovirga sp. DB1703]
MWILIPLLGSLGLTALAALLWTSSALLFGLGFMIVWDELTA